MSDGSVFIYRASELGGCEKALIAKRMGYEPDQSVYQKQGGRMETIFREGDLHEAAIVEQYKANGDRITLQQHEVNLGILPGVIVQGHLDGVIFRHELRTLDIGPQGRVMEIKSMGDTPFKEFKKHRMDTPGLVQKYKWQISAYMLGMERSALLIAKNRNTGEIIEVPIEEPYYSYQDIKDRIVYIETEASTGVLPVVCQTVQFPCPYFYLHEAEETELVSDTAIDAFVKVYREAKDAEEAAKERAAHARKRILALSGGNKLETIGSKVSFYTKKQTKIDYQQMIADYGIDVEQYTSKTESDPIMRITDKTDKTDKTEKGKNNGELSNSQGTTESAGQINLFAGSD